MNLPTTPARGRRLPALLAAALIGLAGAATAADTERVQSVTHVSPGALPERCVMLARMPDGRYRDADDDTERTLCAIDFYAGTHALCPQLSGSRPDTLVYDLVGGPYASRMADFEREVCPRGATAVFGLVRDASALQMAVQTRETPAAAANAAVLYYHFARYFETELRVPPAVLRSMDRAQHLQRVARRGEAAAEPSLPQALRASWAALAGAERDPSRYAQADELFSADRQQVYGALLRPEGRRSRSGFGPLGPNHAEFQKSLPFVALTSDQPLAQALRQTLGSGPTEAAPALDVSELQLALWMREMVDITLLDALLGPQGRVGEVDRLEHWAWVERGLLLQRRATGPQPPEDIAKFAPRLVARSVLDNVEAGLRGGAASQRQDVLERLRHYDVQTYRRLLELAAEFDQRGALYRHVRASYGLGAADLDRLAGNIRQAAATLRASCRAGRLRFDLDPEAVARGDTSEEAKVDCGNP